MDLLANYDDDTTEDNSTNASPKPAPTNTASSALENEWLSFEQMIAPGGGAVDSATVDSVTKDSATVDSSSYLVDGVVAYPGMKASALGGLAAQGVAPVVQSSESSSSEDEGDHNGAAPELGAETKAGNEDDDDAFFMLRKKVKERDRSSSSDRSSDSSSSGSSRSASPEKGSPSPPHLSPVDSVRSHKSDPPDLLHTGDSPARLAASKEPHKEEESSSSSSSEDESDEEKTEEKKEEEEKKEVVKDEVKEDNKKKEEQKRDEVKRGSKHSTGSRDKRRSKSRERKHSHRDSSRSKHRDHGSSSRSKRHRSRSRSKDRKRRHGSKDRHRQKRDKRRHSSRDRKRSKSRDRKRSKSRDRKGRDRKTSKSGERKRSKSRERKSSRSETTEKRRSRSREKREKKKESKSRRRSRSKEAQRRGDRGKERRGKDRGGKKHRTSRSRSRERLRSRSPVLGRKLTFKEQMRKDILTASKGIAQEKVEVEVPVKRPGEPLKPSDLLRGIKINSGDTVTPQMALMQTMAAMHKKAQELTGVEVPKYYNPAAVNPLKYAEQVQKRKLLWSKKDDNKQKEKDEQIETNWKSAFIAEDDGKTASKFRKLMGLKGKDTEIPDDEEELSKLSEEQRQKHAELFDRLDQEYQFARITTHTQRGVGFGFSSQIYDPNHPQNPPP